MAGAQNYFPPYDICKIPRLCQATCISLVVINKITPKLGNFTDLKAFFPNIRELVHVKSYNMEGFVFPWLAVRMIELWCKCKQCIIIIIIIIIINRLPRYW